MKKNNSKFIVSAIALLLIAYGIFQMFQSSYQKDKIRAHDMMLANCANEEGNYSLQSWDEVKEELSKDGRYTDKFRRCELHFKKFPNEFRIRYGK